MRSNRISKVAALCRVVLIASCAALPWPATPAGGIDDDLLAHRLFVEERYAEAAEIFTDPAWKGVALYRSNQWWRAADAFVRANDAHSAHNLGNAYVKLGYHALALQAYVRAYESDPALEDARVNADLMRRLLALEQDEGDSAGPSPAEEALEQLDTEEETDSDPGSGQGGSEESESGSEGSGDSEPGDSGPASEEGTPGDNASSDDDTENERSGEGGGAVQGTPGEENAPSRASGASEAVTASDASEAAGSRLNVEREQATAQWLNRIAHDPRRYLEKRIALELRRREASGQRAPDGGSVW